MSLIRIAKERASQASKLVYYLESPRAECALKGLEGAELHLLETMVQCLDLQSVKIKLEARLRKLDLGEYSIVELRKMASIHGVPYYTRLSKSELLSAIRKKIPESK